MIELFGTNYYFSGIGRLGYIALYIPAVIIAAIFIQITFAKILPKAIQHTFFWVMLVIAITFPLWDVYRISHEAKRLCEGEGGLHIYKTVEEVEGFLGDSIEGWSKYGFKFTEMERKDFNDEIIITRYVIKDGEMTWTRENELLSRYGLFGPGAKLINNHIEKHRMYAKDIETGEILGELIYFTIPPAWIDARRLFEYQPVFCGREPPPDSGRTNLYNSADVILNTLKPAKK